MAANEKLDVVKSEVNEALVDKNEELDEEALDEVDPPLDLDDLFSDDDDEDDDEEEEDFDDGCYEIGYTRGNRCLVCYGEDFPTTFASWLEDIVHEFNGINREMETIDEILSITDLNEFLEKIGIDLQRECQGGECCYGSFYTGWIDVDKQSAIENKARELLRALEAEVEAVPNDTLREAIEYSEYQLTEERSKNAELQKTLEASQAAEKQMRGALDLLGQFLRKKTDAKRPNVWGPFLVTPKAIFVIVEEGGVKLPKGLYNDLLTFIKGISNRPVVRIKDEQYWVYSPLSGSRGTFKPESLEDWNNVWFPKLGFKLQRRVLKPTNAKNRALCVEALECLGLADCVK